MEIRYRDNSGTTRESIERFNKHIDRLGKIISVKGYRYRGRYNAIHEAVMVKGENGSIRLDGLCWGYCGTGPAGLNTILRALGVSSLQAEVTSHDVERGYPKLGTDWILFL